MGSDFTGFQLDPDANTRAKSAFDMWYAWGSSLYNCARILDAQTDITPFKTSYVGAVDAANVSDESFLQGEKTRVRDMLIGMAIEDWLKGLILAAGPKVSRAFRQQVSELTDKRLIELGKTEEVTFEDIVDAMDSPQIQAVLNEIGAEDRAKAIERVALLRDHKHDLVKIAAAVDFNPPLTDSHKKTLRYYSQMIELGRYPALNKPRDLVQVNRNEALDEAREELFLRIRTHCDSLRFATDAA